jgi:hypothetical protein
MRSRAEDAGCRAHRFRTIFRVTCEGTVSQWVRIPPGKIAPASSNQSSRGGNEAAEASGVGVVATSNRKLPLVISGNAKIVSL